MSEVSMATLEKFDLNIRAARDAFIKLDHACLSLSRQLMEAKDENGRLREFVMDLADAIRHDDGFGIDRGWVIERMRELGIEVEPC